MSLVPVSVACAAVAGLLSACGGHGSVAHADAGDSIVDAGVDAPGLSIRFEVVADEAEGCDLPERGRSAVAEDDLIAVGKAEELRETRLYPAHEILDRRLAV